MAWGTRGQFNIKGAIKISDVTFSLNGELNTGQVRSLSPDRISLLHRVNYLHPILPIGSKDEYKAPEGSKRAQRTVGHLGLNFPTPS